MAAGTRRRAAKTLAVVRGLVGLGPGTGAAVLAGSVRGELRRVARRQPADAWSPARGPGRLLSGEPVFEQRTDRAGRRRRVAVGAALRFAEAELEVRFLADDLVRVSWGPDEPPVPWALTPEAGGVLADVAAPGPGPSAGPPAPRPVRVSGDAAAGYVLRGAGLVVEVDPDGSLRHVSRTGRVVRRELAPLRRGTSRTARHLLRPGERVAGLGEQAGRVALAGTHRLWNRDPGGGWGPGTDPLYCVVPVLVGLHHEGDVLAFYENTHEGRVTARTATATSGARVEVTFEGGMLRHYVAAGPLPELLSRYTALTGRPPLPPRWALGYHQSRWGYRTEDDVRAVSDGFAAEGLPLGAVHLDIDHMDGYRVFTVDGGRFGDLAGLARELEARGTRLVAIVDPGVKVDPGYEVYRQGIEQGRFVAEPDGTPVVGTVWPGEAVFPDFTDDATRRWWGGWYRSLLDAGVAGVWHDMNEPTSITLWGDRTLPRSARHAAEGRGADHRECHNAYGALMDHAGAAALAAIRPDRRPWVLSRAGWAGVQRWAWNWTGDSESTWESLAQQVPTVIGLGLSGVAYSGPDIGGFTGAPSDELYLRWLELGVLLPLCRTHCATSSPAREPWRFREPYRSAVGRLVRFRHRLVPYLYTLAADAAATGHPLVRPAWWPGPAHEPWSDDSFLLGDGLLVAPVVTEGARRRRVALPAGRWIEWRPLPSVDERAVVEPPGAAAPAPTAAGAAGPVVAGPRSVDVAAPLGAAPLFVRAGTVLPLDDGLPAFHCFCDEQGRAAGTCFDDAGDGYGPSRRDRVEVVPGAGGLRTVRWERTGEWPPPGRVRVVVHGKAAVLARADGAAVEVEVLRTRGAAASVVECGPFDALELS